MGWTKTLTNVANSGVDVGYWKIDSISIVKDQDWVNVKFFGYSSKANKDAGEDPRANGFINYKNADFPLNVASQQIAGNDIYKLIYDKMAVSSATGTIKVIRHGNFDLSDATAD